MSGVQIELVRGDIVDEQVDAIVTAANESLTGGGGVDAVGPVWDGGAYAEPEVLASCYRRILEVAEELGARSVSIPAISTGLYGYPTDAAARVAVRTLRSTPSSVERVRLVAFDEENYDALDAALTLSDDE